MVLTKRAGKLKEKDIVAIAEGLSLDELNNELKRK